MGSNQLERANVSSYHLAASRNERVELVRLFWHSVTWLRLNVQKPTWFEHDYRVIRREAVKARLY